MFLSYVFPKPPRFYAFSLWSAPRMWSIHIINVHSQWTWLTVTSACAVCQNGPLPAPELGCMKYSCEAKAKKPPIALKWLTFVTQLMVVTVHGDCTLNENNSGCLKVQTVFSDKNDNKARDSGSKGLTAAANLLDLQKDLVRFSQFCYWISLCRRKKKKKKKNEWQN